MQVQKRITKEEVLDEEIFLEELDSSRWWHKLIANFCDLKAVIRRELTIPEFLALGDKDQLSADVYNLIDFKKTQAWSSISKQVNLTKEQYDERVRTTTAFERVYKKIENAWNADFSFLTRSDPAYKACREVWWSHFRIPVMAPVAALWIFGGALARGHGNRLAVSMGGFVLGGYLHDKEFNEYNLDLGMERTLAVLRSPDSQFSRECRLLLKAGDRNHWILREFYERHGFFFDDDTGDGTISTLFPVEFPMPEEEEEESVNFQFQDSSTIQEDSKELDKLGFTKEQQNYLFQQPDEFEGCHHLEELYIRCMDRHMWKQPGECAELKQQLNRCFYRTQFVLLESGERYST